MKKREYHFIVNTHARGGLGRFIWGRLRAELYRRRVPFTEHLTKYPGHACEIALELTQGITEDAQTETVLIAFGGDGTVNEVINGIEYLDRVLFGYIPVGSGNDFARGMCLPKRPEEALDMLLERSIESETDVCAIRRAGKVRRFVVSAGMGFDASVCHEACVSKWKKLLNSLKLGRLSYILIAAHRIIKNKTATLTIRDGSGVEYTFQKAYLAAVMNQRYEGGGLRLAPSAQTDDGLLDVIVISGLPKALLMLLLPSAFFGKHVYCPGVFVRQTRCVEIRSERTLPLHVDGEPLFLRDRIEAYVLKRKLRILVPASACDEDL